MEFATIGYILDWIMSITFEDGVQTSLLYDFEKKAFALSMKISIFPQFFRISRGLHIINKCA